MVARCAALIGGSYDDKREALLRASDGAGTKSKGPPSVAYVFGDVQRFRDNLGRAPVKRTKPRELEPVEPRELVDAATMISDIANLFGSPLLAAGGA